MTKKKDKRRFMTPKRRAQLKSICAAGGKATKGIPRRIDPLAAHLRAKKASAAAAVKRTEKYRARLAAEQLAQGRVGI